MNLSPSRVFIWIYPPTEEAGRPGAAPRRGTTPSGLGGADTTCASPIRLVRAAHETGLATCASGSDHGDKDFGRPTPDIRTREGNDGFSRQDPYRGSNPNLYPVDASVSGLVENSRATLDRLAESPTVTGVDEVQLPQLVQPQVGAQGSPLAAAVRCPVES